MGHTLTGSYFKRSKLMLPTPLIGLAGCVTVHEMIFNMSQIGNQYTKACWTNQFNWTSQACTKCPISGGARFKPKTLELKVRGEFVSHYGF